MIISNEQKEMWRHFWANDVKQRPLLKAVELKDGKWRDVQERYYQATFWDKKKVLDYRMEINNNIIWRGESFPTLNPELGPDAFATFVAGVKLNFSEDSRETNWIEPVMEDYDSFDYSLKENGPVWKGTLELTKYFADNAKGRYLTSTIDLHSNIDALSALRGPQNLCIDLMDCPEKVDMALKKLRAVYPLVYDKLYAAGNMKQTGSTGWIDMYCEGKYTVVQADFICMISPEQYDKFVHPALQDETDFLDHSFLHLDGPGALIHLDRILELKKLDGIQWVSGAGNREMKEWFDVFEKCQKGGKKLVIYGLQTLDEVKYYMKRLKPNGLCLYIGEKTEKEFDEIDKWLRKNT